MIDAVDGAPLPDGRCFVLTRTRGGNVQQADWLQSQSRGVPWLVTCWQ